MSGWIWPYLADLQLTLKTRQDIPFNRTYQLSGSPTRLDILIDVGDVHTVDGRNPAPARACLTIRYDFYPRTPVQCCVLKPCAPEQDFSHSTSLLLGHFFLPMLNGEHEGQVSKCVWWCRIFSINRCTKRCEGTCTDDIGSKYLSPNLPEKKIN